MRRNKYKNFRKCTSIVQLKTDEETINAPCNRTKLLIDLYTGYKYWLIWINSLSENNLFCTSILLCKKVIVSNYNWRFETSIIKQAWFDHKYSIYWLIVNDNDQGSVSLWVLFLFSYLLFETRQEVKKERVDRINMAWIDWKKNPETTSLSLFIVRHW